MGLLYPLSAAQPEGAANPSEERGLTRRALPVCRYTGHLGFLLSTSCAWSWLAFSESMHQAGCHCLGDSEWQSTKAPLPVRPIINVRSDVYRLGTQVSDSKLELNPQ